MTLKRLLLAKTGIETLAHSKFKDGGVCYNAMKASKAYNQAISTYQEMLESAQKEIQELETAEEKEVSGSDWSKKLNQARDQTVEFTPPKVFTIEELIPEGNPHGFEPLHLADLQDLGLLE